jgi:rubrerythrin
LSNGITNQWWGVQNLILVFPPSGVKHSITSLFDTSKVRNPAEVFAPFIAIDKVFHYPTPSWVWVHSFYYHILIQHYIKKDNTMPTTKENLSNAFAGESQANQKYRAFAKKAEKEGFRNIAKLFLTTAEAERLHAEAHLDANDGIGSTVDNLKAAIGGETYEYTTMYPPMLKQAESDSHKAKRMFGYAVRAEEVHAKLYKLALEAAQKNEDLKETDIYLCPVCGHIEFGRPPEACPICGTKGSKYIQV